VQEEETHSVASDAPPSGGPMLVKLVPPRVPPWFVERQALAERLDEAARYRLTTVVAGAGFGKSTQLAARAEAHGWVWYTIDHSDHSPAKCAGGILAALRRRLPRLPWLVLPANAGSDEEAVGDGLASSIVYALEDELEDDIVLVLDDVHELDGAPAALRLVESLVRYAPTELHLVLSSRHGLPFSVARLRGRGQVLDVVGADLAFSADDTSARLTSALSTVDGGLARSVQEATDGWPAAVQLAAEMLRTGRPGDRERLLGVLSSRSGPFYSYLVEEVFAGESPETVELVRTAAQFERVTPAICEALGCANAGRTLADLARRGLVTAPPTGADDWYTLHALVREFVLETWPFSPSELRSLRRRAARSFDSMGRYREALEALTAAADATGIVRLINKRWRELTDQAELDALVEAGAVLPLELRHEVAFDIAHAHTLRGEFDRALEWLSEVPDEGDLGLLFQLAVVHINRDETLQALELLLRAIEPDDGARLDSEGAVMFTAFTAYQLMSLGRVEEARPYIARAFEAAQELPEVMSPTAEAHMAVGDLAREDGDLAAAAEHYDAAIAIADRLGNVLATCSARNRRSYLRIAQGLPVDAVADATEALALADRVGFSLFQAWSPTARGEAYLALGRLDEAAADFDTARLVQERLGSNAVSAPLSGLGDVHLARGELTQARSAYERALAAAERSESVQNQVTALTGLAHAVVAEDEDEAARRASAAVELAHGETVGRALVTRGWLALRRSEREGALSDAEAALANARRRGEPSLLAEALELRALCELEPDRARLEEAQAIWTRLGAQLGMARTTLGLAWLGDAAPEAERAESELRRLGVRQIGVGAGLLRELAAPGARPLAIRTLGHFAVVREGRPVAVSEWQSKKARDLLKILVAHRGHAVTRDVLMELLWPGEDPVKTSNRLSVALNVVRGVLDHNRMLAQDHYLASDGDAIRLAVTALHVDVEEFLRMAIEAVAAFRDSETDAPELLERAEAAYGGEFLEEDRYENWAAPLRDETREAYLDVVRALAAIEADRGTRSATYHLRALALDPYDEEIHLGLVSMLIESGRHGEARRAYRQYVDRMREIDIEPAAFEQRRAPDTLSGGAKAALSEP
jgi:ATP/maltotriose-dependent transcriptional regulator MalT/DNA-binding SARP family transcriptional activator